MVHAAPRMELTLESALSQGGLLGNLSYVLLIASMAMRNIFWLRILAVLSGVTGVSYDVFFLSDPVGAFWESLFTVVNLGQWTWLVIERRRSALTPNQVELKERVFPNLSDLDFRRLVDSAETREYAEGQTLCSQGDPVERLHLLLSGEASVTVDGRLISTCVGDDFVGELGFIDDIPATATVVATRETRCLLFDCAALRRWMQEQPDFERGVGFALNANLASKLIRRQDDRSTA